MTTYASHTSTLQCNRGKLPAALDCLGAKGQAAYVLKTLLFLIPKRLF